ncbi:MAG TPA: decaprenyl-phosphate phosphoribosyltransferase [Chthonomonadaceae bacterium]|nr:decaprenyl-phosphate phosphoribosyltransferase [Chthonomonadaceae bacterium]
MQTSSLRRMLGIPRAILKAIRPKQAFKNLFVYAALLFTGQLLNPLRFGMVTLAFLLFTVVAGSVYLLNDLMDVEADRQHPKKRFRPIASGELPVGVAWGAFVLFAVGGMIGAWRLNTLFAVTLGAYLVLQIAYCFRLKHIVLIDVFTLATGFVLRTVAGGFVIHAQISHWLVLCTLQLALFLGFGKRRQELREQGPNAEKTRAILSDYGLPFLDQMMNLVAGVTIVCYSVYTIESDTAKTHTHLWITVPIVIFGVCRYLYLVYQKGWGDAPDEVLLKDRMLQVVVILWFIVVMLLFKFDIVGKPLFGLG